MKGKNCVAIATDLRIGQQAMLLATNFDKVFKATDRIYVGLPGLATDTTTLREKFRYRLNMYRMKEDREIEPETFAHLMSSTLYERRYVANATYHRFGPYFIEPVVAGINSKSEPFIVNSDVIGCLNYAKDFVVSGTASDRLFGMAESLWEPDLEPEDLFETISQTMLNGIERDALSGMGVLVRVITPDRVIERTLKCRMD
ncbi:proteasome endopeptidase complex [Malassezia vespertilionis]|uniref:proteasome endopeptidase complex n=1 Tax=Malassezia vespertilionis TaxID=2020962 RepID=UPI0024B0C231|nr:proteasome endopeptidase complex [Malassezia vespertilionis]WFD07146.1 proteasome endopeptidase complex [Malassezia vespertilionis]